MGPTWAEKGPLLLLLLLLLLPLLLPMVLKAFQKSQREQMFF
jgi:hypothetical protein